MEPRPSTSQSSSSSSNSSVDMSSNPQPTFLPSLAHPPHTLQRRISIIKNDSTCCYIRWETLVYILGILGIIIAFAKIALISYYITEFYEEQADTATYYFCGLGIALSAITVIWELVMLHCIRRRKLAGLQQWMFAMMMQWLGSCIFGVVIGAVYEKSGLFLSSSFFIDLVRIPPQMIQVHKFIKSEKLNEDTPNVAAYYKKF